MYPESRDRPVKFRPKWDWRDLLLLLALLALIFEIIRTTAQLGGADDLNWQIEISLQGLVTHTIDWGLLVLIGIIIVLWGAWEALLLLGVLDWADWQPVIIGAILTALRVLTPLVLSLAWIAPVRAAIGRNPHLAQILQPLVQIVASIPVSALFSVLLLVLTQVRGGLQIGSIILMMLGTIWYLLVNVIAGAQSIPSDLFEAARVYKLSRWQHWQTVTLPGIVPNLITGIITVVGGVWNASIVSEYIEFKERVVETSLFGCNDFSSDSDRKFSHAFSGYCCDVSSGSPHQSPSLVSFLSLSSKKISVNCIKGYL